MSSIQKQLSLLFVLNLYLIFIKNNLSNLSNFNYS